ncbi:CCA tRNA nucleotidyltransferase [Paenibacillus sp. BC26]|uniref:CCA tRNA nucleotidyltransferase n=1 Tax=Paenibacillus sp. BC26 TaxID=1881032 RepID=UPI0008EEF599|nr:CCA tRNA nucleotidyltransferase [Paenibacillus sp. BC26]SFS80810.1 tRNA nucleotidyltransferase (CCA-adding enzyme) [Paenibacillus sp. BC26]
MSWSDALTRALPLLHTLESLGHESVFVGGCVRDTITGRTLKDVDIATAASPEQVIAAFPHTIPTGLQHGTITVVHERITYEVTTFRTESAYEKFRRPAQVQFVKSLDEDLLRRDFTINSMAMRSDGSIYDPFGGQRDLREGVLRCVGDPDARLQEDALRIVRAVRFAASFDLRIAVQTWRAILRHKHLLAHIAMERIGLEFDKMISGSDPARAAAYLAVSGLLKHTKEPLPHLLVASAEQYKQAHEEASLQAAGNSRDAVVQTMTRLEADEDRWAALCMALRLDQGQADELFARLRYATARSTQLKAVIGIHTALQVDFELDESGRRKWIRLLLQYEKQAAQQWLRIGTAIPELVSAEAGMSNTILEQLYAWLEAVPASSIRELAVKGTDLLAISKQTSGPWLGGLLNELLQAVAAGEIPNDKQTLLQAAAAMVHNPRSEVQEELT